MGQASPKLVSWAAQDGRPEDLIYHLDKTGPEGLKPASGAEKQRTPLILSAIGGHTQCISILYDAGAKLDDKDTDGFTALHHAASNGHLYAVQLLLDLGANPMASSRFGVTPLHLATSSGHTPMLQLLASHKINIDVQESWGQSPLMIATAQSRLECMKTLLNANASTEIRDYHHGNTALHVACTTKDEETVLLLLDAGANPCSINGKGMSSLGVAIENKFYRILPLLLEYGARLNDNDRVVTSSGLQNYLDNCLTTPIPLLRQCRVAVRQAYGPSCLENLNRFLEEQDQTMASYVKGVRDDCCGKLDEIKKHALLGRTAVVTDEALTKF
ncbi:PREDICTED: ankyrin repeat and SOCS box protein 13-like [Amphimedon queenslandica]|uniref:Uncharacterized protein n=1 Tax=Amphimedon queenslandica TaxID=400682 RepID=A0A1X7VU05_AMPQE|nr:PREDICTED: ankyrin repeat and SOCS box protein 13-like [Amphimedon queenslandica]|eukprot:XP_019852596.1 PREDICTED: ankyrin repeat and SOCS box protein 13-like [Amphimedon queenslandica]